MLEVDGPYHFATSPGREPLGPTLWRNTLLSGLGWKVVQIPYFEWNACYSDVDKLRLLAAKLASVE